MKPKRIKIVMYFVIILFASLEAFTLHASEKKTLAPLIGYITTPDYGMCAMTVQCGYGSLICTIPYHGQMYQAYGKILSDETACIKILYSPE